VKLDYGRPDTQQALPMIEGTALACLETAALNFDTPQRRSSLKRLGPFCHCRQRYERNLRRIHASRFVSTRGVWQKPMYLANSAVPRAECGGAQAPVGSGSLWTAQTVHLLYREQSFYTESSHSGMA
jgi:hypothetical protein